MAGVMLALLCILLAVSSQPIFSEGAIIANNASLSPEFNLIIENGNSLKIEAPPIESLKNTKTAQSLFGKTGAVAPSEYELYKFLFNNYSANCRPRKNALNPVEVTLQMDLFAINDIREKDHSIIITATLNMVWMDEFLVWHYHQEFSNIGLLVVTPEDIWRPDFAMITAANMYDLKMAKGININLYSDGQVTYNPKSAFVSTCQFDLTYFPFDTQHCVVTFEAWTYLPKAQYFTLDEVPITMSKFMPNEQWHLLETDATAYISCPENATGSNCNAGASFDFYLARKPAYYNLNIIVPTVIISIAELSTFTLPIGEPMKVHISFTCLLAFSVFQTAINADMPRTSDHTPLLSAHIVLIMSYIAFAILGESFVFFSLALAKEKTPLPEFVKRWFVLIGKLMLIDKNKVNELADDMLEQHIKEEEAVTDEMMPRSLRAAIARTEKFKSIEDKYGFDNDNSKSKASVYHDRPVTMGPSTPDAHARDWFYIALVASRFTSMFYLFLIFVTPLFMFLAIPITQSRKHGIMGNLTVSL